MPPTNGKLTLKQKAFCQAYTDYGNKETFGNALRSAEKAGYKGNSKTLQVVGAENLSKPIVIDEIATIEAKREGKAENRREKLDLKLNTAYLMAKSKSDCASMVGACRAKAKLYGLETDVSKDIGDKQRILDETEAIMAEDIARLAMQLKYKQGA